MSIKSIKEKQLLVNLAKSFGQEVDPFLLEEVKKHQEFENGIKESIRTNIFSDLNKALLELKEEADRVSKENNFPLPPSLDDLESILDEETKPIEQEPVLIQVKEQTITDLVASAISSSVKNDSFKQPDPILVEPDIVSIQKKIKFLEQWLGKISAYGPGGGASDTSNFTSYTRLIDTPSYSVARKDFYMGVNYNGPVTINLPSGYIEPGRNLIIKDESGNCKHNPITVSGNIDNDPDGFTLKINNGAIQLIYRNGWRIV
jgi:hypothetical protein